MERPLPECWALNSYISRGRPKEVINSSQQYSTSEAPIIPLRKLLLSRRLLSGSLCPHGDSAHLVQEDCQIDSGRSPLAIQNFL